MTPQIVFTATVIGQPQTAGSKRAFVPTNKHTRQPYRRPNGGIVVSVVDDNPKSRDWKSAVSSQVFDQFKGRSLLMGPLFLRLTFYLPRPKGHYGSGKNAAVLKASADATPKGKPDVLKLARAVEDALTSIVWNDDAQIVDEHLSKRYGTPARVEIEVGTLPATVGEIQ